MAEEALTAEWVPEEAAARKRPGEGGSEQSQKRNLLDNGPCFVKSAFLIFVLTGY